jgi:molybdenum cofactor cytidylyltransferase
MLALLLAAGRGSRVGAPKALLDLGGMTALERCVRALRAGGADELRVVVGHAAPQVRAALPADAARGVEFVVNPDPDRGQTSSVRAGLAAGTGAGKGAHADDVAGGGMGSGAGGGAGSGAGGGALFVLHTVDHPLLRAEDLTALLAAFARRAPGQRIAVPRVQGRRGHPALFEAALAAEFLALGDDEPGHAIVRRDPSRVLEVPLENPWLVRDIDTPEDLAAAREALG